MKLRLLGPTVVVLDGGDVQPRGARERALLAVLALAAPRGVTIDRLIEDIWGHADLADPANTLQLAVSRLRRVAPQLADAVTTDPGGYRLALGADAIDVHEFDALVAAAEGTAPLAAIECLEQALDLWRGAPLSDVGDAPFVARVRPVLEGKRASAVVALSAALVATGRPAEAVEVGGAALEDTPFDERLWIARSSAEYAMGRSVDALRTLARARDLLREELGVEPGQALNALEVAILHHDTDAIGIPQASPLRLVGRTRDLAVLSATATATRWVTVTGPAGVGKTALAGAWAQQQAEAGTRVVRVDLMGALTDGEAEERITLALEGAIAPGVVVIDDCERTIGGCRRAIATLLAAEPAVRVLATSRRPIAGEHETLWPLAPLDIGDAAELFVRRAAVIVDRADAAAVCARLDGVPLAVELCAALTRALSPRQIQERLDDSMALLRTTRPVSGARWSSLRASLEWGNDLLTVDAAAVLRRMSPLPAEWGLDTAEALAALDGMSSGAVAASVAELVDSSLVSRAGTADGPRYSMLPTVRQFAVVQLQAAHEVESVALHAATWVGSQPHDRLVPEAANLAAALRLAAGTPAAPTALAAALPAAEAWRVAGRVHEARNTLHALLADEPASVDGGLLSLAYLRLSGLSYVLGMKDQAEQWSLRSLSHAADTGDPSIHARALAGRGNLLTLQGQFLDAHRVLDEALDVAKSAGPESRAEIHRMIAVLERNRGQVDASRAHLGAAARLSGGDASFGDRYQEALLKLREGAADDADAEFTALLEDAIAAGDDTTAALCRFRLAQVFVGTHELERAEALAELSRDAFEEFGDAINVAETRVVLANIYRLRGEYERAAREIAAVLELVARTGHRGPLPWAMACGALVLSRQGRWRDALTVVGALRRLAADGYGLWPAAAAMLAAVERDARGREPAEIVERVLADAEHTPIQGALALLRR